jgi:2-keto-4-pentenoate hydratase/2-oxohepta-3-ene-1,7-dioic acid hydratase in catechol pathway
MRFTAFEKNGTQALGVHVGDALIDLSVAAPELPQDLRGLLEAGLLPQAYEAAQQAPESAQVSRESLVYLPPISNASKIICLGLNYYAHAAEGGYDRPEFPTLFMRGNSSLVGCGQPIVRPQCSFKLDYEAELVAVIGKQAKHVKEEDALDYVAGYSVFNDGSIRDYQKRTPQWTLGKNFDNTGGFGPDFVTADELPAGATGLRIQSRLNGQILQDSNTDKMIFSVAKTIEILTECLTLNPGDVLVMGTPDGVGHARTPPIWMKDGDTVEIEIEGIGLLTNPIVDEKID